MTLKWWGYLHESGSIQLKRYFDNEDIYEAEDSPFVQEVLGPFEAESRDEAILILQEHFKRSLGND
jgi:hypothetical protein